MSVIALVTWVITAGFGFFMLTTWVRAGGVRAGAASATAPDTPSLPTGHPAGTRFPPPLVFGHFLIAAAGLVVWIIYVATDSDALAWVAFVLIVVAAAGGDILFLRWWRDRDQSGAQLPEQTIPKAAVYLHGLFAVVTIVLVFLTAFGVGGS
jgi:manganese efflux pump family protein